MKKLLLFAALAVLPLCANAQEEEEKTERLDSVVVSASRAGKLTPVTYSSLGKEELRSVSPSASMPMVLDLMPSVVTYNEGGTGLGYSWMTIRGSKGSQINVTLNGITLNDSESQEVFWVNIPSLSALISSVQVQRGLGTSSNGPGSFGASINMNTAMVNAHPSGRVELSGGSFGTAMATASASTGLLPSGLYFDLAVSLGRTDGYIRNAKVKSASAFAVLGWLKGNNSLRLTYLMGLQNSGITWDGIDLETYAKDRRYNSAGEYIDDNGNVCYYDNQIDSYGQHHLQLNYTHAFTPHLSWSNTLDYTRGDGFDEYYKQNKNLQNYGFPASVTGKSDMVYRKQMGNNLFVYNTNVSYRSHVLDATAGAYLSSYDGMHWGNFLWVKTLPKDYDFSQVDWYSNNGRKLEATAFVRAEYRPLEWLTAYADMQFRSIRYRLNGKDDDWIERGRLPEELMNYTEPWNFFNPRAGVSGNWGAHKVYFSAALGHREPGRADIKENIKGEVNPITPEKMLDLELGYSYQTEKFSAQAGLYMMEYWNMLLETGRLSSSGYAIKENVPRGWRRGIELAAAWKPLSWMQLDGNLTLSMNRIANYTSYVAYDDYSGRVKPVNYGETTMLMSPSVIGMARASFLPWKGGNVQLNAKYVGKQYLDNTAREEMKVPAYWTANLSVSHTFPFKLKISGFVNNIFNNLYYAAGWRWEAYSEAEDVIYSGIGVYPQPPVNFMIKLEYTF